MRVFRRRRKDEELDEIIEGEIEEIVDEEEEAELPYKYEPPRRGGRFRRRRDEDVPEIAGEATFPLERVAPDIPTPDEAVVSEYVRREPEEEIRRRGLRLPRIRIPRLIVWHAVRPGLLLLASTLIAGGVLWTMHNRGQLSADIEQWWPAFVVALGFAWAILALIGRRVAEFLAAVALMGIGISLLLDTQDIITWQETIVGIVLITVGVGIIARGLLLRQGTVA
jgi:hypothetical protein